ncbi:MAG TPA: hypothetical protein VNS34_21645 [Rhizobiaceae bacterium]|nr:hypothetical protein [Rhizobiaceae bacterium]
MTGPSQTFDAQPIGLIAANLVGTKLDRKTRARLGRGDSPRSGQPVWRNSYYEGQIEKRIWRPLGDGTKRTGSRLRSIVLDYARRFETKTRCERRIRAENRRNLRRGLLGEVGVEVLGFMWGLVDFMTGRLEPAIQTIADELGRSYSAVHQALVDLRRRGFLQWERRARPIEDPVPGGQLVEQIPNAYVLLIPPELRDYVRKLFAPAPAADCVVWDHEQRKAEFQRALAAMSASEFQRATWDGDTRLGETMANIARMIDERESLLRRETGGSY